MTTEPSAGGIESRPHDMSNGAMSEHLVPPARRISPTILDEWGDLFTEQARFHVAGESHEGREAIIAFIRSGMPPERRGRHLSANAVITLDSWNGTATVWSDYVFVDPEGTVAGQGRYHDVMERGIDKVWRFVLREVVPPGEKPEITDLVPAHGID